MKLGQKNGITFLSGYSGVPSTSRIIPLELRYSYFYKGFDNDGFFTFAEGGIGLKIESEFDTFPAYMAVLGAGYRLKLSPGASIDFGPETLQNLGACVEYASVEEFVCETNADILVPTEMPEGYFIKSVSLTAKSEKVHQQVVFVTNAPARVSVSCTWNKGVDDVYRHSCRRIEQVGQYLCYFTVDPGKKQCNFTYKGNEYVLTADSYADLYRMIANMKGSLEE